MAPRTRRLFGNLGLAAAAYNAGPRRVSRWLAGDRSLARVLSDFNKLQRRFSSVLGDRKPLILRSRLGGRGPTTWYRVRVAESTRERATELCARLERAGGSCLVKRN